MPDPALDQLALGELGLGLLLEQSREALMLVETETGRIARWGPAAARLFGYTAAETEGQNASFLLPVASEVELNGAYREAESSSLLLPQLASLDARAPISLPMMTKLGEKLTVEVTLNPLECPRLDRDYCLVIMRDVSEQKRMETEIALRAAELEWLNQRLRESDHHKEAFLSVLSHELRTPLNIIQGFTTLLDAEVDGPLNQAQRGSLAQILEGSSRMLAHVTNLLEMGRVQTGKFTLAPLEVIVTALVDKAIASLRPMANSKHLGVSTDLHVPDLVLMDGRRFIQLLTHLLENAIKFTPDGGSIHVRVWIEGGALLGEVVDSGIGIAEADQASIFYPFQQVDMSSTREVGGLGLGLSLCKAIVEAHGGTIGVRSQPGAGSTFWFVMPHVAFKQ